MTTAMRIGVAAGCAVILTTGVWASAVVSAGAAPATSAGKSSLMRACVEESTGQMFIRDRWGLLHDQVTLTVTQPEWLAWT